MAAPGHTWHLSLGWRPAWGEAVLRWHRTGSQHIALNNTTRGRQAGYHLLGASLNWRINAWLDLGLSGENLLDAPHLLALRDTWRSDPRRATASAYAGVLGVPALLPRAWFDRLREGSEDQGARDLLRARAEHVHAIAAPALADDIDTPRQAARVTGSSLGGNPGEE